MTINSKYTLLLILSLMALCGNINAENVLRLDSWMSRLSDTTKVCKVAIPGTHDALTGEGFTDAKFVDDYTTQVAGIDRQLNEGLRYFDVRLVMVGDGADAVIQTSHRTATIKLSFSDVLRKVSAFLEQHSKEFVILKIQYDGEKMTDLQRLQWNRLMQQILSANASMFVPFTPDMRVKDIRGKVLLLSRTCYGDKTYGAYTNWTNEGKPEVMSFDSVAERTLVLSPDAQAVEAFKGGDNVNAAKLYVQDYYNTIGDRQLVKQQALTAMLLSSNAIPYDADIWVINHASGFGSPKMNAQGYVENASHANALLLSLLRDNKGTVGIVAMDFACVDLAPRKIGSLHIKHRKVMSRALTEAIIESNFK